MPDRDTIHGTVTLPDRGVPAAVWLSLRVPQGKRLLRVTLNGAAVDSTDMHADAVRLRGLPGQRISVSASLA